MTRNRLLGAVAAALTLVAALAAAPSTAFAAEGQVDVSVPTTVPCVVKHDGTVITPSSWEMKNVGSEEISLGAVSVTPSDEKISLSASYSVGDAEATPWFSYQNGFFSQAKTGETLAPGASVSVDWSVGKLDATANASTLEATANGAFTLAKVDFTFGQKKAFAVWFSDNTAGLYKRFDVPSTGDTFDDRKVIRVEKNIEDEEKLFDGDSYLTSVTAFDEGIKPKTTRHWFDDCYGLTTADLAKLDMSGTRDMDCMFYQCYNLDSLDVSGWDVSNVWRMNGMFAGCSGLDSLDVSNWNVSNVTDMGSMFYGCSGLDSLDVSGWKVSNVTRMDSMFYGCNKLASLDVSGWDVSKVTDMDSMFYGCSGLSSLDVSGWKVSNVTRMDSMFCGCSGLDSLDVKSWDVSNVESMGSMFRECAKLSSLDFSGWNTAKLQSVHEMFNNCPLLCSLKLGANWTMNLRFSSLPGTLYGTDGKPYALDNVPLGVAATYYTKAEYVPQGDPADKDVDKAGAPEASAAGQDNKSDAGSIQDTGSENVPQGDPADKDVDKAGAPEASAAGQDNKSDAGSIQDTGSENGSPEGADSPVANGQDETPLAA